MPSPPSEARRGIASVGDPVRGMFIGGVASVGIVRVGMGCLVWVIYAVGTTVIPALGEGVASGVMVGVSVGVGVSLVVDVLFEKRPESDSFELGKNRANKPSL